MVYLNLPIQIGSKQIDCLVTNLMLTIVLPTKDAITLLGQNHHNMQCKCYYIPPDHLLSQKVLTHHHTSNTQLHYYWIMLVLHIGAEGLEQCH